MNTLKLTVKLSDSTRRVYDTDWDADDRDDAEHLRDEATALIALAREDLADEPRLTVAYAAWDFISADAEDDEDVRFESNPTLELPEFAQ